MKIRSFYLTLCFFISHAYFLHTEHFKAKGLKGDPYVVNLCNLETSRGKFHPFIPNCSLSANLSVKLATDPCLVFAIMGVLISHFPIPG